ncbi:MAG: ribbon-helix-helix protein, CopG family [Phormidesmis sp. CAN_BIN36]|nr:ribbon-helix-helix protein, CopG family [Phormidesmis sp. CAN_BIN36]
MKQISFRISDAELEHLKQFCQATERNQSDVLRELIRKLSISGVLNPLD